MWLSTHHPGRLWDVIKEMWGLTQEDTYGEVKGRDCIDDRILDAGCDKDVMIPYNNII